MQLETAHCPGCSSGLHFLVGPLHNCIIFVTVYLHVRKQLQNKIVRLNSCLDISKEIVDMLLVSDTIGLKKSMF